MVTVRRRKQRAKKDLAKAARDAKKQRNLQVRGLDRPSENATPSEQLAKE
jgi:hypothetical protein